MSKALVEKRRAEAAQRRRRRNLITLVAGLLLVAALAAAVVSQLGKARLPSTIEGLRTFSGLSRDHALDIDLQDEGRPPAGGAHHPQWQNCGVYREPVETINGLHSLEHGAVWLSYHPDLPAEQVALLEAFADDDPFVLVSPYPGQESPIIATAWGAQVDIEQAPDGRIDLFVQTYRDAGPEAGAVCAGGLGTPIS
jgi:hypothetical protein